MSVRQLKVLYDLLPNAMTVMIILHLEFEEAKDTFNGNENKLFK
jgi:hypothetical protein